MADVQAGPAGLVQLVSAFRAVADAAERVSAAAAPVLERAGADGAEAVWLRRAITDLMVAVYGPSAATPDAAPDAAADIVGGVWVTGNV